MGMSACDAIKDALGLSSETIKSDINPDLFEDDQLIECVARLTQGLLLAEVQDIFCAGQGISSLNGLEQFTNLRTLVVNSNRLSQVDLSPFPKLAFVDVSANRLDSIDLSHNPDLVEAFLDLNNLAALDVRQNTKLEALVLSRNNISTLDLSQNPELEELVLDENALVGDMRLGALDLSNNSKLINLNLFNNEITHIDLSNNANLDFLDIRNNNLIAINLFNNTNLTDLRLNNNELTSIDLSPLTKLDTLLLENNQIQGIDLPVQNGSLRFAFLRGNQISCSIVPCSGKSYFPIPFNDTFIHLDLSDNLLVTDDIDLLPGQNFTELLLSGNQGMTGEFDLFNAPQLVELRLDDTQISSLTFGGQDDPQNIFSIYDIQVIDASNAPLDETSKNILDAMEAQKGTHPDFDPDILSYTY